MADVEVLARRVRWLDRWRRLVAIGIAAAFAIFLSLELGELDGGGGPEVHVIVFSVVLSGIVWWLVEAVLAWITAVYEARVERADRIPRAQIRR